MKKFLGIVAVLLLAACGAVDVSAINAEAARIKLHGKGVPLTVPVITSNGGGPTAAITITTAQIAVTTVTATGTTPITYSKSGADTALFSINASTGVLALLVPQVAADYHVTVTATNTAGVDSQNITLTVAPVPPGTLAFTHVPIGGAGATIGVQSVQSANVLIAKTDQFNCYLSVNGSQWAPLLLATNTPVGRAAIDANGVPLGNGCDDGIADPGNVQNIWVMANGVVVHSANQGATFTDSCYTHLQYGEGHSPSQSNGGTKSLFNLLAVDPANSNIVYMSTPSLGLVATFDGGVTCFTISAVGTATVMADGLGGGHVIAFDTSGGTTATCPHSATICTKNVYVSTYGTGVYKSTDATNFSLTTSTPTTHLGMRSDNKGNLFLIDNSNGFGLGVLRKYNGTVWSTPSVGSIFLTGIAIDENHCASAGACRIITMSGGGTGANSVSRSDDGGATWNNAGTITTTSADVPWLADFLNAGFGQFPAGLAIDNSGFVYTGGEGVFKVNPPASGATVTFVSFTAGIEESLSSSIITSSATSGKLAVGTWDLNCFVNLAQPYASFPVTANRGCYSTNGTTLQHTYNMDWASATPSFMVALTDSQGGYGGGGAYINYSGKSTDGGVTWTALAAPPIVTAGGAGTELKGGCIAASSTTNYMWLPTDGNGGAVFPQYTTNGGTTWNAITVSGIVASGWPFQYYIPAKVCAADRVTAGVFYLYNWNDGTTGHDAIVKCTGGGASCSIQSVPALDANRQFLSVIKTVPGNAGHVFLSTAGASPVDSSSGSLNYYTDGGVTKNIVPNMKGVLAFGFGAAAAGHSYPTIVVNGVYNGVYGIWQSIDWDGAKTWQQIGPYPKNLAVTIEDIDGDKVIPNVFYYTTNSGVFCSATSTSYCNGGT